VKKHEHGLLGDSRRKYWEGRDFSAAFGARIPGRPFPVSSAKPSPIGRPLNFCAGSVLTFGAFRLLTFLTNHAYQTMLTKPCLPNHAYRTMARRL